ncbi:MAG: DUF1820 family protein [Pseudobacteriovorax sp.]|nr:DUF1820 family protein [Pseudobacteriovorax sp.]
MNDELIYRVRFKENEKGDVAQVLVRNIEASDIPGLICMSEFVFKDTVKKIILPEEDAASKRFRKTESLHVPYHSIVYVEKLYDEPTDLKHLPFLRQTEPHDSENIGLD